MKNDIIDICVRDIKYDPEFKESGRKYNRVLTVSLAKDFILCAGDIDDTDEIAEAIADEIESATGVPPVSFKASIQGFFDFEF